MRVTQLVFFGCIAYVVDFPTISMDVTLSGDNSPFECLLGKVQCSYVMLTCTKGVERSYAAQVSVCIVFAPHLNNIPFYVTVSAGHGCGGR